MKVDSRPQPVHLQERSQRHDIAPLQMQTTVRKISIGAISIITSEISQIARAKRIVTEGGRESLNFGVPDARKPHRPKVAFGSGTDSIATALARLLLRVERT
jgi:hypothetical protein